MKKRVLAFAAIFLIAAGCNQQVSNGGGTPNRTNEEAKPVSESISSSGNTTNVSPDDVITQINSELQTEQALSQTDDSDLFKSDADINSFSEVKNAN